MTTNGKVCLFLYNYGYSIYNCLDEVILNEHLYINLYCGCSFQCHDYFSIKTCAQLTQRGESNKHCHKKTYVDGAHHD